MSAAFDSTAGGPDHALAHRRYRAEAAERLPAGLHLLSRRGHAVIEGVEQAAPALLLPTSPVFEEWLVHRDVRSEQRGCLSWSCDGEWLHGTALVDDRALRGGLEAAALQAYSELFELLETSGCPHPAAAVELCARHQPRQRRPRSATATSTSAASRPSWPRAAVPSTARRPPARWAPKAAC
ncbi:hypothetical protein [Aquabacterium sp. A7-Y]|uniref:chorismate transformation enzyme, FkbO/Hyg5 family n=1 Tax=Aquabacterium sp. A7-Y TaxID=1349605 RepID=UPI0039FD89EB